MTSKHLVPKSAVAILLATVLTASAAEPAKPAAAAPSGWQKPAWLTDLSVGVKEGYDDNVLMVVEKGSGLTGMNPQSSWITTVSPKLGFNFAPLLGGQKTLKTLSLVYSPDFAIYHDASAESYNAHKLANAIKGKTGDFSFSLENAFLFTDGDSAGPRYWSPASTSDANRSAYATATARERRKQIQDRTTIVLQYDVDKLFIRPTASLLYYDLMTDWHNTGVIVGSPTPIPGYQNYADRADVNGGLDLGYRVTKDLAVTVGYRYGHQYQQAYTPAVDATVGPDGRPMQSTADYQRLLFGLEGKPWKWLAVKLACGPEFRDYNSSAPVNDSRPVNYYGEAALTATLSPSQTLAFTYKHFQWVSSTGKIPYADSAYALAYHWNATKQLGVDLSAKYLDADYTYGNVASSLRDDVVYSLSAGVSYAFTPQFSTSLGYTCNLGRNAQDNATFEPYREFEQNVVSLAAQFKF